MAARAIASGTIAFGLVSIPVKLFPSTSPSDAIRFNQLHAECGSRIKTQYFCPKDEVVVSRNDLVKGYEFAKGKFVTFTPEELKAVEEQSSGSIDITEFVPVDQVDPIYYAKAYYLAPDQGAGRAYHLLGAALKKTGLVALAKYAARGKQYLVMIRPSNEGLVMQQLHYPSEIRAFDEVGLSDDEVKEGELELALKLIEQTASKTFNPEAYADEVRSRVEALIQKKVEGQDITQTEAQSPKTQVIDLMAALKQSLSTGSAKAASEDADADERKGPRRAGDDGHSDAESKAEGSEG